MNSPEAKMRKQQSILMCSGLAVILFGAWEIIRMILMRYMDANHFMDYLEEFGITSDVLDIDIIMIVLIVVMIINLFIRSYVGISAIKEGMGLKTKGFVYLLIALIQLVVSISADIKDINTFINVDFQLEYVLTAIIDISIHIATFEILISAIRLRIFRKKLPELL